MDPTDAADKALTSIPEIITAAAKSELGLIALALVLIALVALAFFRGPTTSTNVKLLVFGALLLGTGLFVVAMAKERQHLASSSPGDDKHDNAAPQRLVAS